MLQGSSAVRPTNGLYLYLLVNMHGIFVIINTKLTLTGFVAQSASKLPARK